MTNHIQIAICDDEELFCNDLDQMLTRAALTLERRFEIKTFLHGKDFFRALEAGFMPDIVFLDVDVDDIDGITLGMALRKMVSFKVPLIYVSHLADYALRVFPTKPFHFFKKPIMEKNLIFILIKVLEEMDRSHLFTFTKNGLSYSFPVQDILYFEAANRQITLHTLEEEITFKSSLGKIEKSLSDDRFLCVHQSYLVNTRCVIRRAYDYLLLHNQEIIPISQKKRSTVRHYFMNRMD